MKDQTRTTSSNKRAHFVITDEMKFNRWLSFRDILTIGCYKTPNSRAYILDASQIDQNNRKQAYEEMERALSNRRMFHDSAPLWQRSWRIQSNV